MKKIISALVLLGSMAVISSGCSVKKATLVNTQELSTKGIKELEISYNSDSVNLYESDSDKIKVEEYLLSNKKNAKATIKEEDNQLTITGGKRISLWFTINDDSHIDIYLPKDYHEKLGIDVTSGTVRASETLDLKEFIGKVNSGSLKLKGIKASHIQLSTTSGSVKADSLVAETASVKSNSGSIKVEELISQTLIGEATSGSIKISKVKSDAELTANSGSIKLGEVIGSAKLKATSGAITALFTKVSGDISAETNSGSIKLDIPKDVSFNFSSETNSGSVSTDFDDNLTKEKNRKTGAIGSDPEVTITTKATSGSIKITRH